MNWKLPYIFIVKPAGHGCIGTLNTLFCSFCEFPVACQSIVTPLGTSGWCIN